MDRLTIAMRIGLVWALISILNGCTLIQEWPCTPDWIYPKIDSQYESVEQLTAKLKQSQQVNLALEKENDRLKLDSIKLMIANRELLEHNLELTMKIDMLKILDHRVEEKRKNYSSD